MGRQSVLSVESRREIARLYDTGRFTKQRLADTYGVSWSCINHILKSDQFNLCVKVHKDDPKSPASLKAKTRLIEAMADYAAECHWSDALLIKRLRRCGLTLNDFVTCGYGAFAEDNLKAFQD